MQNLDGYTKVFSWNTYYGRVFYDDMIPGPVCYMFTIGGSKFVGYTDQLSVLASHHLMLLMKNKHPNKMMQDVFDKEGEFEVYILEQLPLHSCIPNKRVKHYIDQISPDLNEGHKELVIEKDLCRLAKFCESVSFLIEPKVKECIDKLCNTHNITLDEMIYSAVITFVHNHKYRNIDSFDQEGIACIARALYTDDVSKLIPTDDI